MADEKIIHRLERYRDIASIQNDQSRGFRKGVQVAIDAVEKAMAKGSLKEGNDECPRCEQVKSYIRMSRGFSSGHMLSSIRKMFDKPDTTLIREVEGVVRQEDVAARSQFPMHHRYTTIESPEGAKWPDLKDVEDGTKVIVSIPTKE